MSWDEKDPCDDDGLLMTEGSLFSASPAIPWSSFFLSFLSWCPGHLLWVLLPSSLSYLPSTHSVISFLPSVNMSSFLALFWTSFTLNNIHSSSLYSSLRDQNGICQNGHITLRENPSTTSKSSRNKDFSLHDSNPRQQGIRYGGYNTDNKTSLATSSGRFCGQMMVRFFVVS